MILRSCFIIFLRCHIKSFWALWDFTECAAQCLTGILQELSLGLLSVISLRDICCTSSGYRMEIFTGTLKGDLAIFQNLGL